MINKLPEWLKVRYNSEGVKKINKLTDSLNLNTVCNAAKCPNIGECYSKNTATFMIMGQNCSRNCSFCNVRSGKMTPLDPLEPYNVFLAVKQLDLKHVVITSVTRDDLDDGGASHFAKVVTEIKKRINNITVEVLIPDFKGNIDSIDKIIDSSPEIINHNIETIGSLYSLVRPQADYKRSLNLIKYIKEKNSNILTKSGFMVGLGETKEEIFNLIDDLKDSDCDILTIGQYLQPTKNHYPVKEYIHLDIFLEYKKYAYKKNFKHVFSGPLVRSSYCASDVFIK